MRGIIIIIDALRVCNEVELGQIQNNYNMRMVSVNGGVKITLPLLMRESPFLYLRLL